MSQIFMMWLFSFLRFLPPPPFGVAFIKSVAWRFTEICAKHNGKENNSNDVFFCNGIDCREQKKSLAREEIFFMCILYAIMQCYELQ